MRSNKEKKLSERYIDLPENKERYSSLCFICINMPITKIIISANDTPTEERDGNSKYKKCKDNKKPCEYCNEKKGVHKYYNGEVELFFDCYRIGYPVDNQIVDMLLRQLKGNGVFKGKKHLWSCILKILNESLIGTGYERLGKDKFIDLFCPDGDIGRSFLYDTYPKEGIEPDTWRWEATFHHAKIRESVVFAKDFIHRYKGLYNEKHGISDPLLDK